MAKKNREERNFVFKTTMYFDIAQMYSKKSCKKCHGKGYQKFISPPPENKENYSYCSCAAKNIKKYG